VRIYSKINASIYDDILNLAKSKWIDTATIRCQYSEDVVGYFNERIDQSKVTDLILYSGNETNILKERNKGFGFIGVLEQPMTSSLHCGYISQEAFVVNGEFIRESLKHNSCLNGKISINSDGKICNCPASNETYGHYKIKKNSEVLIKNKRFQSYWKINKDLVEKCKECEFRYICVDCRSIREQDDLYSAPLKCGYDPKTGTWEKWQKSEKKAFRYKYLTNK
jgi:SPASM domain peptide maturase of grasp-with-spasm system